MSSSTHQLVWFITGASSGLGLNLAREALTRSDLVFATSRSPQTSSALQALKCQFPDACHLVQLDVTASILVIKQCVSDILTVCGRIDVVVNNAGYSLVGLAEEAGAESFHKMFQTNLYGPINVTNAFLPYMRERQSGTIVFVGSRSGWRPMLPVSPMYGSSKAALHAFGDTLSVEVSPFSIRVLNAIPGGLRTHNIENSPITPDRSYGTSSAPYKDYDPLFNVIDEGVKKLHGSQTGDATKAARTIVDVVRGEGVMVGEHGLKPWPGSLYLGSDCLRDVQSRCEDVLGKLETWGYVGRGIDIDSA
ncbi:short-chain oxidoreductase [Hysterangium stoloniferum]|nr:short-chain oxidoreductase [Hysterangium stoloniferum]